MGGLVECEPLDTPDDLDLVQDLMRRHVQHTGSELAERLLRTWQSTARSFVKVMPRDYKRVLGVQKQAQAEGRTLHFTELVGSSSA